LGGTLTNFSTIQKNLKKFSKLLYLQNRGFLNTIDGKKKMFLKKKISKLERRFGGILNLKKLPTALIVTDCLSDKNAILEAHKLSIPIIGIADSNSNINFITVPIVINTKSKGALTFILSIILNLISKNMIR
jgi:small subunit ribosomal protein S2